MPRREAGHVLFRIGILQLDYVARRRSLGTVNDFELDPCSLIEGLEAFGLDRSVMDEYIRPVVLLNETKTL